MNIVGLDIGKRKAHACVTDKDGTILEERSIVQRPEELSAFFAKYRSASAHSGPRIGSPTRRER